MLEGHCPVNKLADNISLCQRKRGRRDRWIIGGKGSAVIGFRCKPKGQSGCYTTVLLAGELKVEDLWS